MMNRPPDPRMAYVAVATKHFAASGYHGTSLAAVARDAGVSKQALLHFFGRKEKLYAEVLAALAARLRAEIDAAQAPDPVAHLQGYFQAFQQNALADQQDIKLVVRALLDSTPTARTWPMKPYLDRLAEIARATPGGAGRSQTEILAWLSQIIGVTQYQAISAQAVAGMYGAPVAADVGAATGPILREMIDRFVQLPAGG